MTTHLLNAVPDMKTLSLNTLDAFRRATTLTLAATVVGQFCLLPVNAAQDPNPKRFQIKIQQDGFLQPANDGPSLGREDIKQAGDPFSSSGAGEFDPGPEAFQVQTSHIDPSQNRFAASASDQGDFNGQGMPGNFGQMPQQQQQAPRMQAPQMQPPTQINAMRSNDPDNSQEMQLAWDEWHRRVAEAIFNQIGGIAKMTLPRTQPLQCVIHYTITRDGRVVNVNMQQNSPNIIYNAMVFGVVTRMAGNPVLQFPQGSRRMQVEKMSTFSHNAGPNQGFRYIQGDKETMRR